MKKLKLIFIALFTLIVARAEEGMIIPSLIAAFESDMKAMGMKLSANDIYNINKSSLKDAIIQFNGGCTAEIVSNEGLILTNHHCGFSQIQYHSSLEKDYLKNGFWAKNKSEELMNPNLVATRIVRIEDVTQAVLFGTNGLTGEALKIQISKNAKQLVADAKKGTHYDADIQAFDFGNSYYMMVKETFQDVRLVGTPPSSIGKFGGDTDNWVWPRHTGDFSVFRIYAGPDNKPAPYNTANVPYKPLHFLPISFKNRKEGDFTMVYGFPGQTEQHLSSGYLKYIIEKQRPMEISMRTKSLQVIDAAMRSADLTRIQYAAKQARIANAWKKNIGQIDGLKQRGAVQEKEKFEAVYNKMALSKSEWNKFSDIVRQMNELALAKSDFEYHYYLYVEYLLVGPEFFKLTRALDEFVKNFDKYKEPAELQKKKEALLKNADAFFKDYDPQVDKAIYNTLTEEFNKRVGKGFELSGLNQKNTAADVLFTKSFFTDKERYKQLINSLSEKAIKKIKSDGAYQLFSEAWTNFQVKIGPEYQAFSNQMDDLLKVYVEGKRVMFPDAKHWPDANSTLRITYGKLEGSAPTDGMRYTEHTTLKGMIDKYNTGNPDFELDQRMKDLYAKKEYGNYAQGDELWVCFTGSNHTTGGNSGSPVLDENGYLMGLNFDRSWESTMSDYFFDPNRCRNIVVDIRYVLWVMDIYCGARHLVDEMTLKTN